MNDLKTALETLVDGFGGEVFMPGDSGDAEEGEVLLQPLRELGDMVTDFSGRMNYCDFQQLFDTLMPAGDFGFYWKARYLTELPNEMIDLATENASAAPSDNSISSLWNFGGATSRVAADATAFGDRFRFNQNIEPEA
jgi:hypothetical protein